MKQTMWAEAMLESYSHLETFADAIDKKIKILTTIQYLANYSANDLSNKVIDLIEKKVVMCNTKVLIERIFKQLDCEDARILMLLYVDKMDREEVAEHLKVALRTVYRKLNKAKDSFVKLLTRNGYDENKLNEIYSNQYWMLRYVNNASLQKIDTQNNCYDLRQEMYVGL